MAIKELVIKDEDRKLFAQIQDGNNAAIMQGLSHPGAIYRVNAIINAVRYKFQSPALKIQLNRLKEDQIVLNGYKVSEFAISALDILGLEVYLGNDLRIKKLINSKFEFE